MKVNNVSKYQIEICKRCEYCKKENLEAGVITCPWPIKCPKTGMILNCRIKVDKE